MQYTRTGSAVYEDKVLLRRCILKGSVVFGKLREVLGDLIDLWPSIRPFISCTGLQHLKERVDSVSISFGFSVLGLCYVRLCLLRFLEFR